MQAAELGFHDLDELGTLRLRNGFLRLRGDPLRGRAFIHGTQHDLPHKAPDRRAVTQTEGIGVAQRLPHRRITRTRPPVCPGKHVPQILDAIQLVDA